MSNFEKSWKFREKTKIRFCQKFSPPKRQLLAKTDFWNFWCAPPLFSKNRDFGHFVTFGRLLHPKIGTSKCPHARPRAPPCTKLSRDPPTTIPHLPCNFGGDCGRSAREIREKRDFGRVPPPMAERALRVPRNTKIEISRNKNIQLCWNFQGALRMV